VRFCPIDARAYVCERCVSLQSSLVVSLVKMWQLVGLLLLGPAAWAQQYSGCPEPYGIQTYPHETYCDKFYKCVNGM
jgi:hypothetical protein